MSQLMEVIGPVRVRLDFDCNDTQDDMLDLLEEIAPYSGTHTPQESEKDSGEESEGEESDEISVVSKESTAFSLLCDPKVDPGPSDYIVLQSKVARLETELTATKRTAKRARIEEEAVSVKPATDEELSKRIHDLEQERNKVMEDLLLLKLDLKSAQDELGEKTKQYYTEQHENAVELRKLKAELTQANSVVKSCSAERDYYASRYEISEEKHKLEVVGLMQTNSQHQDHIRELTTKVNSLQLIEQDLFTARMMISHLEREKRAYTNDVKLVQLMKSQINEHESLTRLNARLIDENKVLRETSSNVELLKYQSLTLEEKVARLENMEAELAKTKLENQDLRKKLEQWCGSELAADPVALQRHISELQQRDVMNISKVKELETNLSSVKEVNTSLRQEIDLIKVELGTEKVRIQAMEEIAMRRERRLTFLTKERDGYINVLKSYQLDDSVDQQIKELQDELVKCQAASNGIIKQLEAELEKLKPISLC